MATCDDLAANAAAAAKILREYTNIANNALAAGLSGTAEQVNDRRNTVIGARQILDSNLARLRQIKTEQENNRCTITGYSPEIRAATALLAQLDSFAAQANEKINQLVQQEERATTQSTTKQNNQGTGKPGTAGQGPNATPSGDTRPSVTQIPQATAPVTAPDGLQEVTVVGNKIKQQPLQISEPNLINPGPVNVDAPNLPFNQGDDDNLDTVNIQGNKLRDGPLTVQEPGLIGAGDINVDAPNLNLTPEEELEEVTVTGRRVEEPNTTSGAVQNTRKQANLRDQTNFEARKDWRVRLSLSPGSTYLYNDMSNDLLAPLRSTDGVLFPYTPSIQVNYAANYAATNPTHSNYTINQYENSSVDNVVIGCEFTAQDSAEARYMLAVIHFFRSATKMFYGQDQNPKPGTPPPLCYLFGLGEFQFNAHPLAIQNFNYSLPADVDYIRAGSPLSGEDELEEVTVTGRRYTPAPAKSPNNKGWGQIAQEFITNRLASGIAGVGNAIGLKLSPGGELSSPSWVNSGFKPNSFINENNPTYVPTKIALQITCVPIISRYEMSNFFSLKDYANGSLLRGVNRKGAAFW